MKYIADGLTALRVFSAAIVLLAIWQGMWTIATLVFIIGLLTDAFDGTAARRWPYSNKENARLWWRKDAHKLDNNADVALSGAAMVGLGFSLLVWWQAVIVIAALAALSGVIQLVVDRTGVNNPKRAERIDVAHGWLYVSELAAMLILLTAQATDDWERFLVVYSIGGFLLLWAKWDRATSRSELTYGAK
ncbi:CDP-alcohol phosphatidyltransferase family protein [Candidatus Saccharibacteria bacterium]|nr:CDP-alcohol phosphatidyltransferase family protein [Candidatus Saccharibacteria bacterium]